jgi:hypothetical protein
MEYKSTLCYNCQREKECDICSRLYNRNLFEINKKAEEMSTGRVFKEAAIKEKFRECYHRSSRNNANNSKHSYFNWLTSIFDFHN